MSSNPYLTIRTAADVEKFQDISNGLHDGYITRVEYHNTGISSENSGLSFDYTGTGLLIHVLVTSLPGNPTFELVFHSISEWQISQCHFSDMTGFSILFLNNGMLLWADDTSPSIAELKQGSYVIAESIQYRQL